MADDAGSEEEFPLGPGRWRTEACLQFGAQPPIFAWHRLSRGHGAQQSPDVMAG